jgi:eukaryotic-like serine/threonine-protein kinase
MVTRVASLALLLSSGCALIAGVEDGELRPSGSGGAGADATSTGAGNTGPTTGGGGAGAAGGATSSGVGGEVEGMINVPGDTFMMGCNDGVDNLCNMDEAPYHSVTLSGYRIDQYEVSRGDYNDCIVASSCTTPACDFDPMALADNPVTCVTWDDAHDYCAWAGKRLPTEAEWEYAARGTTGFRYPWGNVWNDDCSIVNGNLCQLDTSPVTDFPQGVSPVGAFNMAGNVAEWVNDWYQQTYYASSPTNDPQGPATGGVRGIRGGSWDSSVVEFRTSYRGANTPSFADNETGFRCAL